MQTELYMLLEIFTFDIQALAYRKLTFVVTLVRNQGNFVHGLKSLPRPSFKLKLLSLDLQTKSLLKLSWLL